jgi:hypothetical protein
MKTLTRLVRPFLLAGGIGLGLLAAGPASAQYACPYGYYYYPGWGCVAAYAYPPYGYYNYPYYYPGFYGFGGFFFDGFRGHRFHEGFHDHGGFRGHRFHEGFHDHGGFHGHGGHR